MGVARVFLGVVRSGEACPLVVFLLEEADGNDCQSLLRGLAREGRLPLVKGFKDRVVYLPLLSLVRCVPDPVIFQNGLSCLPKI